MIKVILAAAILSVAMASGASASMAKMDHMKKMGHMDKCGKGMMMMHGKCAPAKMMKKK